LVFHPRAVLARGWLQASASFKSGFSVPRVLLALAALQALHCAAGTQRPSSAAPALTQAQISGHELP
jgi:hypothetical protein